MKIITNNKTGAMENRKESKNVRAFKKIGEIKKFYWLVAVSIVASLFMVSFAIYLYTDKAPYSFVPITIFLSTPLIFGVVLIIEYIKVFGRGPVFGKRWEERQIKKYLENDN